MIVQWIAGTPNEEDAVSTDAYRDQVLSKLAAIEERPAKMEK